MAGGALLPGCLVLRLVPPPSSWPPPAPPPPTSDAFTLGLYLSLLLLGLLLMGVGLALRRAWLRGGDCMPLDREDQALLRTARDALVFLIKRRMKRLRLVR